MERICAAVTSGVLLAVILAICAPNPSLAIECGTNKSHNAFFGTRGYGDTLLYENRSRVEGKWLRTVSSDIKSGRLLKPISYIEVLDNYTSGNGGCSYLTLGGVGNYEVNFHFKSQRSEGLDFSVRVYGR